MTKPPIPDRGKDFSFFFFFLASMIDRVRRKTRDRWNKRDQKKTGGQELLTLSARVKRENRREKEGGGKNKR